jgi:hypothetical protein
MGTINELAISTAPEIWLWAFRGDRDARECCFSAWWESDDSMFSHRLSRVISEGGEPVGLELGYSHAEKVAALEATVAIASKVLQPAVREHLLSAFPWFDYLCPPIPDRAYYVQHLGMQILSESRVPFLEQYDIPALPHGEVSIELPLEANLRRRGRKR